MCCLVHASLVLVFLGLHIWFLAIFNMGSVTLYYILLKTIHKTRYMFCFFCAYVEIVLHTLLCIIMIGSDSGFPLYILAVIPVLFFIAFSIDQYGHLKYPIIYASCSILLFFAANIYNFFFAPLYQDISKIAKLMLFLYNSIIAFSLLTICSLLFILQIRASMTEIENQKEKLTVLANIDPLTGLLNRRKFKEDSRDLIQNEQKFSILLSDIDDFKKVNDTYGHDCGDEVLVHVTSQIKNLIKEPNLVCRWGGEEIIVLYTGTFEEGLAVAELLRARIANSSIRYNNENLSATITIGVAFFDGQESLDRVIVKADKALYKGKQNGKNQVQMSRG